MTLATEELMHETERSRVFACLTRLDADGNGHMSPDEALVFFRCLVDAANVDDLQAEISVKKLSKSAKANSKNQSIKNEKREKKSMGQREVDEYIREQIALLFAGMNVDAATEEMPLQDFADAIINMKDGEYSGMDQDLTKIKLSQELVDTLLSLVPKYQMLEVLFLKIKSMLITMNLDGDDLIDLGEACLFFQGVRNQSPEVYVNHE